MNKHESAASRLKSKLSEFPFDFKKSLGQNFLISDHIIEKIFQQAGTLKYKSLLEIGPGLGSLTDGLKQMTGDLTLLELDRRLVEYWRGQGLEVIETDALKWDWTRLEGKSDVLLVSNLPYQISSSIVIDRCEGPETLRWMILMFQKEVAQRLIAPASSPHYGLLSVMAQLHFKMKKVVDAAPRDFQPAPKVASRVLFFERKPKLPVETAKVLKLLKQGFAQRRKKLVNNLKSLLASVGEDTDIVEQWLLTQGLSVNARAEELSPEQWLSLCVWIEKVKADKSVD